ncbi:MAG: MinD/ParA family protein [Desulfobacterales bacterium]|jgi:flagellar biosynthesis protein FlhG
MTMKEHNNKVIALSTRKPYLPAIGERVPMPVRKPTRIISITSGKGGVGKTNIVANLGYQLSRSGIRVLILDADMGLGNLDILLGLAPRYNLSHVLLGEKRISEIVIEGPGQLAILPAASGIQELTQLSRDQKMSMLYELDQLLDAVDVLLIDSAAGISANVLDFSVSAQEIMVVVTPEPTSITDAYALMKVLSTKYAEKTCRLIVNQVASEQEGREIFRQLNLVARKFLAINMEYFGCILQDDQLVHCVKQQRIVCQAHPESSAAHGFRNLARKTIALPSIAAPQGDPHLFWGHMIQGGVISSKS